MLSADRLQDFVVVADAGSISAAARQLELPRATLSRRLSGLEQALGVRLIHRSTRRLVLTPAGEELYRRARRVVSDTDAAWAAVRQLDDTPRGPLRVSVPGGSAADRELFIAFARDHPEVRLEVSTSPRHVDLVAEGIDVAVRFGAITDPSLIARRLWTSRSIAVATPPYLHARGVPKSPDELQQHDCIVGFAGESVPERTWPLTDGSRAAVHARLASSGLDLRIDAVRAGLGIGLVPEPLVRRDLDEHRLQVVLPGIVETETPAHLVFVDREFLPPQVRAFIERATEFYRARLPR